MRVLAAPAFENRDWNPYNAALYEAVQRADAAVEVGEFRLQRMLREHWDLLHTHWFDNVLNEARPLRAARWARYATNRLPLAHAKGMKVVWTAHNLQSHEELHPRIERAYWNRFLRGLDAHIHLSHAGRRRAESVHPRLQDLPGFVIPHGHYRGQYPDTLDRDAARTILGIGADERVVLFFGQVRPYKDVPRLVEAFRALPGKDLRLCVAGKAEPDEATRVHKTAGGDPRILLHLDHVRTERMQDWLRAADLVVLPYREIYFSGSALLALSFDRPVLAPRRTVLQELQEDVGDDWVRLFDGDLDADTLSEALDWATRSRRSARPDLSAYDWDRIGALHVQAYREILDG